jgi:hypothetical protein
MKQLCVRDLGEGRKRGRGYRSVNNLGTKHAEGSSRSASGHGLRRDERRHGAAGRYTMDRNVKGGRIMFGKLEMRPNARITTSIILGREKRCRGTLR